MNALGVVACQDAPLGIDVAQAKLDVALLRNQQHSKGVFANTAAGFEQLLSWLQSQGLSQVPVCLEATGSYSDAITRFLLDHQFPVSVLNPAVLVDYRESLNVRSKTDALDASLLAHDAQERHPRVFQPLADEILQLRSLIGSRQDLMQMRIQETNRLHATRLDPQVMPIVQEHISHLTLWQQQVEEHIQQLLSTSGSLRAPWEHAARPFLVSAGMPQLASLLILGKSDAFRLWAPLSPSLG